MLKDIMSCIEYLDEDIKNLKDLREHAEKRFTEIRKWGIDIPVDFKNEMERDYLTILKKYDEMIYSDLAIKKEFVEQLKSQN